MQTHHWIMFALLIIAGYIAGRMWPQLGQTVGLP
jgi:hypothetical protein